MAKLTRSPTKPPPTPAALSLDEVMAATGLGRTTIERFQLIHIFIHEQIAGRVKPAFVGGGQIQRTRGEQSQSKQAGKYFVHEAKLAGAAHAAKPLAQL